MAELVTIPCERCSGSGIDPKGGDCKRCSGVGTLVADFTNTVEYRLSKAEDDIDDMADKINDILDKCNDIFEKVSE